MSGLLQSEAILAHNWLFVPGISPVKSPMMGHGTAVVTTFRPCVIQLVVMKWMSSHSDSSCSFPVLDAYWNSNMFGDRLLNQIHLNSFSPRGLVERTTKRSWGELFCLMIQLEVTALKLVNTSSLKVNMFPSTRTRSHLPWVQSGNRHLEVSTTDAADPTSGDGSVFFVL